MPASFESNTFSYQELGSEDSAADFHTTRMGPFGSQRRMIYYEVQLKVCVVPSKVCVVST
jgi:hypothetical protein